MGLTFDVRDGTLWFTTQGEVDFVGGLRTLQQAFAAASAITAKEPGRTWHLLFDLRESTESRSSGELRDIATLIGAHRGMLSGRCAIVVSKPLYYGLSRVFSSFMDGFGLTTAVLHSSEEALEWLDTPVA